MLSDSRARDWLSQLQADGCRLTYPRQVVVETMAGSRCALSPAQVYDLACARYPALGLVTVYRTLEKLEQLGLIQRVHQPDGCHAYLPASQGHQHLLLCRTCGQAEYFSGDDLAELIGGVARKSGYQIEDHWLQLFGVCERCQQTAAQS
jgi:Fe2+ or Zn2+ uptake regulation protein